MPPAPPLRASSRCSSASTVYTAGSMSSARAAQRGGHLRHLRHVQPHLRPAPAARANTCSGVPCISTLPVGQHGDALRVPGDLLHAVAHQHHGRAAWRGGRPVSGARMASRPAGDQVPPWARPGSAPSAPWRSRRRWPPGASARRRAQRATCPAAPRRRPTKRRRLPHTPVDLLAVQSHVLRAEGDVLVHRLLKELVLRVLEHQPHLEAHVRGSSWARPRCPSRRAGCAPAVGCSRPLRCWISVDLPEPVWPMMPRNSPLLHRQAHTLHGAALKGRARASRCGSGSLSSMIGSNAYFPSAPPKRRQMASAHSSTVRRRSAAGPSASRQQRAAAPPCPAPPGPAAWSCSTWAKTSCGAPSMATCAVVHDDDPVGARAPRPCGG